MYQPTVPVSVPSQHSQYPANILSTHLVKVTLIAHLVKVTLIAHLEKATLIAHLVKVTLIAHLVKALASYPRDLEFEAFIYVVCKYFLFN